MPLAPLVVGRPASAAGSGAAAPVPLGAGRRDGVKLVFDGEFWAELDAGVAAERGLSEGLALSEEDLSGARVAGERPLAMSRALSVLGYRARSAQELRE